MLWTTVQPSLFPVLNVESKLRRDRYLLSKWRECFSDQFLIRERAVNLRCIEESDAALHGGTNERDALLPLHGRPVPKAQSHAAESDGGHFQIAFSNFALLHKTSPSICFVLQTGTHYDTACTLNLLRTEVSPSSGLKFLFLWSTLRQARPEIDRDHSVPTAANGCLTKDSDLSDARAAIGRSRLSAHSE